MVETTIRVLLSETGDWVVNLPGGDQYRYPRREQAEAFATAVHVFHDNRASAGSIKAALEGLEENQLHDTHLSRKLRSNLERATTKESKS